ncbi:pyrimidine dimer DNA glycosylase/endonuclease V [Pseudactinotalea sp. Z1748]|uniref:pyrimidine dimer DNA glycosylase/endonuclease V n=1 Tax=Pseudactinotalea sp. Z1748 TaxID=3413027 RepID=UPI003C7A843C
MRLWSLHPRYLDRQGLLACWREALLAQAVLTGRTVGYRSHPQLDRFRTTPDPAGSIRCYLRHVADEADARGYRFDRTRIDNAPPAEAPVAVTSGQVEFERAHLRAKLVHRSPATVAALDADDPPDPHPLFMVVPGPVEPWERG